MLVQNIDTNTTQTFNQVSTEYRYKYNLDIYIGQYRIQIQPIHVSTEYKYKYQPSRLYRLEENTNTTQTVDMLVQNIDTNTTQTVDMLVLNIDTNTTQTVDMLVLNIDTNTTQTFIQVSVQNTNTNTTYC